MSHYAWDGPSAAHRHYEDAVSLEGSRRFDNAGYHFGLAAESALKELLLRAGVPPNHEALWKHFPELRDLAAQAVRGRGSAPLLRLIDAGGLPDWEIKMRYAKTGSVRTDRLKQWRDKAREALAALE